jgi:prepilin-type N-terminal cleavage/methylation domain-containing protein
MKHRGYTLIETMVAVSILSFIALLSWVVIRSSHESTTLAASKSIVQQNLRDVMNALTAELELAYAQPLAGITNTRINSEDIRVSSDGRTVTYWRPAPLEEMTGHQEIGPIVIRFEDEDVDEEVTGDSEIDPGNAKLDPGEDKNGDGTLTRRVVRIFNGQTIVLGAANDLANVQFQLLPNVAPDDDRLTRLRIRLESSKRHGMGEAHYVFGELETTINLLN